MNWLLKSIGKQFGNNLPCAICTICRWNAFRPELGQRHCDGWHWARL